MATCLFTGDELPPTTREEHAIPRSLGGRIRSRSITSDRFNNATSHGFDDLLAAPYANTFNYLAPLLSAEHEQGAVNIDVAGRPQHRLFPGGELGVRGLRVEERDTAGRPVPFTRTLTLCSALQRTPDGQLTAGLNPMQSLRARRRDAATTFLS